MKAMNEGDFDARVNALAHGDLLSMKSNVNDSMDRLSMAVTGITSIISAQSNGDLTRECTADFRGQLKQLQDAINTSSRKLKSIVAKAVYASNIVSSAAEEVSRGSSDLSQRVQEQAAALEETSATMDEMNSAVQANTENAQQAAQVAKSVQLQASEGSRVMQQTIEAMSAIQQSSHKIADIVSLIDGIAFQTNLLALNAAVEAARAGEHGRGFAVVAGEVRALAHKSAEAAKDIKKLIDESVIRIDEGTHLASQSGSVLKGINDAINGVAGMVQQIAQASGEQSEGISQVHRAVSQIDQVTQQNAALVEETTAAAESLSEQSIVLREDMAFFNTGRSSTSVSRVKPRASVLATLPKPKLGLDKSHYATEKSANQKSPNEEWSDF
jgi:methyl-accepting chemotaxis protein